MTGESGERSQHPVDVMIRDVIATQWQPASEEVDQIVQRMAGAPFSNELVGVQTKYRGLTYQGIVLGRYQDSFTFHFMRRIVVDEQ